MRKSLAIVGALLALAAFASTADARMGGGGGMSMSPSMSHGTSMPSAMGSPRGFSPDGRSFSASGQTFSPGGFQTRVKGSNWKKPIDSDNGGEDPPKAPKTPTKTSGGDDWKDHPPYGGWYGPHHPHGEYYGGQHYGGYHGQNGDGNVPQRTCKGGC